MRACRRGWYGRHVLAHSIVYTLVTGVGDSVPEPQSNVLPRLVWNVTLATERRRPRCTVTYSSIVCRMAWELQKQVSGVGYGQAARQALPCMG